MKFADDALIEKHEGKLTEAAKSLHLAYECEAEAARLMPTGDVQPTLAVLFRSAASLAIQCGELEDAETLIEEGLKENCPPEIAAELEELRNKL
jgi:hypothetical protein